MSVNEADAAFTALAADLLEELSAGRVLELAAGLEPPRPPDWRTLTPRQLSLAEAANPDYRQHGVTPDRPGAVRHCDYCGSARAELVPGADGEDGAWVCRDERQCLARKAHRWPPRPDLVLAAALSAVGAADEADAARLSRQAAQLPAPEPESQQQPGPKSQQQPGPESQQEGWQQPAGWQVSQYGAYDVNGQWHPSLPQWHPTAHLISGGAPMSHAISGGAYMGHAMSGMARGQRLPVPPPRPQQAFPGGQPAGTEIPPEGLPEGVDEAPHAGHGVDVQLQRPELPEAAPQRPARSRSRRTRWR